MADYWISQNRKYCDFCRCWITDNKPSVEFHEKGRRHQENVKRRLRYITRQSSYNQKQTERIDSTIKQMEIAALNAYKKDIVTNPDLTSINLTGNTSTNTTVNPKKLWNEVKNRNGETHFINVFTNEKVFSPPTEGFMSIQEQRDESEAKGRQQLKELDKYQRQQALLKVQEDKRVEVEEKARLAREKLKERRVVDDTNEVTYGPLIEPGKTQPYGKWQTVNETKKIDYQLPEQEYYESFIEYEPEPIQKEFKEKIITSIDVVGTDSTTFKKRKFGGSSKKNARQRLDTD